MVAGTVLACVDGAKRDVRSDEVLPSPTKKQFQPPAGCRSNERAGTRPGARDSAALDEIRDDGRSGRESVAPTKTRSPTETADTARLIEHHR